MNRDRRKEKFTRRVQSIPWDILPSGEIDVGPPMFENKTVFVVGAGASSEVGFPTGYELKDQIAERINIRFPDGYSQASGDRALANAFRVHAREFSHNSNDINPYLQTCWAIGGAMPLALSIDNYLDAHRENPLFGICGKLAITRCILESERNSSLKLDGPYENGIQFSSMKKHWLLPFFHLATEGIAKERVEAAFNNVSFITFNYDRSIEHFIEHALQAYYQIDQNAARQVVDSIPILHPYGTVGSLPWQGRSISASFGEEVVDPVRLLRVSSAIKTFTEREEDPDALASIKSAISEATTIVFLGFAYHKQNLELLKPPRDHTFKRVFGTTMGFSRPDQQTLKAELLAWARRHDPQLQVELLNNSCSLLFSEYWRSLSRSL
jgi:hypothetical protein